MGFNQAPALPYRNLGIVQDGDTASQAIEKDKYIIWKGSNYFAKTDILQGETFVVDTNLTAMPEGVINGIVDALNASLEWHYLGEVQPHGSINFPAGWKEIHFVGKTAGDRKTSVTFIRDELTSTLENYSTAGWYYGVNYNGYLELVLNENGITDYMPYHTSGTLGSSNGKVWYR